MSIGETDSLGDKNSERKVKALGCPAIYVRVCLWGNETLSMKSYADVTKSANDEVKKTPLSFSLEFFTSVKTCQSNKSAMHFRILADAEV